MIRVQSYEALHGTVTIHKTSEMTQVFVTTAGVTVPAAAHILQASSDKVAGKGRT